MSHGVPHEAGHTEDSMAKRVGVLAGVLAIGLTIVTISSHRSHTRGIVTRSEANDLWAYFQSKRIKLHTQELGLDLLAAQGLKGETSDVVRKKFEGERERLRTESEHIQEQAKEKEKESEHAERRALHFDIAEGLFEIGLVMASMYFLAHRKVFPAIGVLGGLAGAILGIIGFLG
jgi:hypothetical protein